MFVLVSRLKGDLSGLRSDRWVLTNTKNKSALCDLDTPSDLSAAHKPRGRVTVIRRAHNPKMPVQLWPAQQVVNKQMKKREIKFRVWNKDTKKMYGWDVVKTSLNDTFDLHNNGSLRLMLYTGIQDRNKKEIYEGDICRVSTWKDNPNVYQVHPNLFEVCWSDERAKFELYSPDELWGKLPNGKERETDRDIEIFIDFDSESDIYEVVGNEYQNPELYSK